MSVNESFWVFFYLTDSRCPPAELKVSSELSGQNPVGTLYAIISVLNAIFYENINEHYLSIDLSSYNVKPLLGT